MYSNSPYLSGDLQQTSKFIRPSSSPTTTPTSVPTQEQDASSDLKIAQGLKEALIWLASSRPTKREPTINLEIENCDLCRRCLGGASLPLLGRSCEVKLKKIFGAKKEKEPPPSIQDASERIYKRGETVDEKIKKLDVELGRYKEQLKKARPGPSQEAIKARAMRVLKQKRMYEGQRDMLYNQTFNLDQVAFVAEGIKDAQQTMSALKSANKELNGMMKTVKIQDIDNMQDELMDLMDVGNEIQESLGRSYNIPDYIDEEDLMGELDALEADMGSEIESSGLPTYLQSDNEPDINSELNLPTAPTGHTVQHGGKPVQLEDEFGLPPVPRASIRG